MRKTILSILSIVLMASCADTDIDLYGDINGIVTDGITNQPVQGALVSLSPVNSSKTTGNDGKYGFTNLNPTEYIIQVSKSGYTTNTKTVTVVPGEAMNGDVTLMPIVPELNVSVTSLNFGSNLTSLPIAIRNFGQGTLNWNVNEDADWVAVNPLSGTTTTEISNVIVSVDRSVLAPGNHSQTVSIISNGGNATISITITKP